MSINIFLSLISKHLNFILLFFITKWSCSYIHWAFACFCILVCVLCTFSNDFIDFLKNIWEINALSHVW